MGLFDRKSNEQKAQELFESAAAKSESNDRQGAVEDLTKVIALTPNASEMYYYRGNEYYSLNLFDKAQNDFQTSVNLDPNNDLFLLGLAGTKRQNGDMKGAYRDYTKAIKINPENSDLWHNRGHLKRYAMDMTGARQDFEMAVKLGDNKSRRWVETCSFLNSGKSLDEFIDLIALNADELVNEGINYKNQGNWQMALGSFTRAAELYPHLEKPARYKVQLEREIGI